MKGFLLHQEILINLNQVNMIVPDKYDGTLDVCFTGGVIKTFYYKSQEELLEAFDKFIGVDLE